MSESSCNNNNILESKMEGGDKDDWTPFVRLAMKFETTKIEESERQNLMNMLGEEADSISKVPNRLNVFNLCMSTRREVLLGQLSESQPGNPFTSLFRSMDSKKHCPDNKYEDVSPGLIDLIQTEAKDFCANYVNDFYNQLCQGACDDVDGFANLVRTNDQGEIVMHAEGPEVLVSKGSYTLKDLLKRMMPLQPKPSPPPFASVGVTWDKSTKQLLFPKSFSDHLPVVTATDETLGYYDCCFANERLSTVKVGLNCVIDKFSYSPKYIEYIEEKAGGAALERHPFPHLDRPESDDSGYLVLAKFTDNTETTLNLTAFKVPPGQCVYIPENVIHTNDYFIGNWHTMLSEVDPELMDLVHLVKGEGKEKFSFSFSQKNYG